MNISTIEQNILKEINDSVSTIDNTKIYELIDLIKNSSQIFCVGAGRSKIMLSSFCMRLNHLGMKSFISGGIPCPPAGPGDLIIAASGSGCTPTVLDIMKKGKEAGAKICLYTAGNNEIAKEMCNCVIEINAPTSLFNHNLESSSHQLMRTLFEQTVFILNESIIAFLSEGMDIIQIGKRHTNLE